jgi:hypothetical protein
VPFLLAEGARSECAPSMRAVKGSLGHSSRDCVEQMEALVGRAQSRIDQATLEREVGE